MTVALLAALPAMGIIGHEFVFDSIPIIKQNTNVHSLASLWSAFGQEYWPPPFIGLYRPVSIILFALQWSLGEGSPALFHSVSIVLYVGLALTVYRLALQLLTRPGAWVAAALFAVHPLHTEAVASAVNQSELLVALLLTLATTIYLEGRRDGDLGGKQVAAILALYILACFTKEHGLVLPGLLVAAEMTVAPRGPKREKRRTNLRVLYWGCCLVGLSFIAVRSMVLQGDIVGSFTAEALVGSSLYGRLLTMLAVVPEWARLLVWPAHLQTEYTPQEIVAATHWGWGQVLGSSILALAAVVAFASRHKQPAISFGILWMAVSLVPVHNVLAPTGVILAERTLLLASIGMVIAAAAVVELWWERASMTSAGRRAVVVVVGGLTVAGVLRTATRYPVWRDQFTAFEHMVQDAPLSYKAHFGHADLLAQRGRNAEAESEYRVAIELYPASPRPYQALGNLYRRNGLCWGAIETYDAGLAQSSSSDFDDIRRSLIACLMFVGEYRRAGMEARIGIAGGTDSVNFRRFRAVADSALEIGAPPGTVRITMD